MSRGRHLNKSKVLSLNRIFLFLPTPHPESSEIPINTGKLMFQHSPQLPTQTPPNTPPNTPPSVRFSCTIRRWGVGWGLGVVWVGCLSNTPPTFFPLYIGVSIDFFQFGWGVAKKVKKWPFLNNVQNIHFVVEFFCRTPRGLSESLDSNALCEVQSLLWGI